MKKSLGIFLLLMCMGSYSAVAENQQIIGNPDRDEMISLYTSPYENSTILGHYYPGAMSELIESDSGWSKVTVGKNPGTLVGYVRDSYIMNGWLGRPDDVHPIRYEEVWNETSASVSVYALPDEAAPSMGEYLNGTIVRRIGECGEWSHIEFSGYGTVFIKTEYLKPTTRQF